MTNKNIPSAPEEFFHWLGRERGFEQHPDPAFWLAIAEDKQHEIDIRCSALIQWTIRASIGRSLDTLWSPEAADLIDATETVECFFGGLPFHLDEGECVLWDAYVVGDRCRMFFAMREDVEHSEMPEEVMPIAKVGVIETWGPLSHYGIWKRDNSTGTIFLKICG
jgi:hypothetical protein